MRECFIHNKIHISFIRSKTLPHFPSCDDPEHWTNRGESLAKPLYARGTKSPELKAEFTVARNHLYLICLKIILIYDMI